MQLRSRVSRNSYGLNCARLGVEPWLRLDQAQDASIEAIRTLISFQMWDWQSAVERLQVQAQPSELMYR
jgi:hypothetical protein